MDLELPEIPFSISEFQQAGLLLEGEGYLNDPIAEMQHAAPADQMLHLHFASGQSSCQPGSSESLSPAEQGPSQRRNNSTQDPQQSRLQPSPAETLGRRRQANREHQRRYREKRKV